MRPTSYLDFNQDYVFKLDSNSKLDTFNLLDQSFSVFQYLPKNFKISTNDASYEFNIDMLKDTSSTILDLLRSDPHSDHYHLDINDEKNVMAKIEKLYCGKKIAFNANELIFAQKISELLNLVSLPNFLKPYHLHSNNNNQNAFRYNRKNISKTYLAKLSINSLILFLQNSFEKSFKIIVNKKEYFCNIIGIRSSKKINEMIEKDPNTNQFVYEIDDDFDDFQIICDLFNFESIKITNNNMNSLKQFAEDLQIECILQKIDQFIEFYENAVQAIDDKQLVIDEIDEIFDLLYNRNNQSIEFATNFIINSKWSKTEENVLELAAFILQTIEINYVYHQFLFDLIMSLDKEANEVCQLKILVPTIAQKLMKSYSESKTKCAFVYRLYKKGIINKNQIEIQKKITVDTFFGIDYHNLDNEHGEVKVSNIVLWFYPEILEKNEKEMDEIKNRCHHCVRDFIEKKYSNNPIEYLEMRDNGEPTDIITRAIIKDDLDTMQKIISQRNDFSILATLEIPFNLFDSFVKDENISYINYAAYCGSLHCFKYLLLNQCKIDNNTLYYAVYGENYEIIRIVDQYYYENNIEYNYSCQELKNSLSPIVSTIIKHQNNLFDWILQERYINQGLTGDSLSNLLKFASNSGNVHALIKYIDNGLNLNSLDKSYISYSLSESLKLGYFKYSQLFLSFIQGPLNLDKTFYPESISFGNLSIFKLIFKNNETLKIYGTPLNCAINDQHLNIIKYIVDFLFQNNIKLSKKEFLECLRSSIEKKSDIFNYLINRFGFEQIITDYKFNENDFIMILSSGCQSNSFENVKISTNLILEKYPNTLFTEPFIIAVEYKYYNIYKYFIDKNVSIDLITIADQSPKLKSIDCNVFIHLIKNAEPEIKEILYGNFLRQSLTSHNKDLVEYLLSQNIPYENALFDAISSRDVEIVKIVLKHNNKLSFINQISENGTPLYHAVTLCNSEIVKYLLSIPGIDPSLYQQTNKTPLIYAIINFNMEIINLLLDFYGDEIQSQMWQLNEAMEEILGKISNEEHNISYFYREDIKIDHKLVLSVIKRLLGIKNLDLNCHARKHTLLTYACKNNDYELVKMIVESKNVNINSYAPKDGNTPLMIAIEEKNFDIAKLIIKSPKSDINLRNYNKETALTIAVQLKLPEIVSFLINNEKFDAVESRLDYAFFLSSGEIANELITIPNLEVNYRLISTRKIEEPFVFETSLIHAVKFKDIEKVKLIINHKSFDQVKSQIKTSIFEAVKNDDIDIFRELMPLIDNDVNIFFRRDESLLIYAVKNRSVTIIEEILNNEKFDSKKCDLLEAFICTFNFIPDKNNNPRSALYFSMIKLYNFDIQHDHLIDFKKLLPNGKSYFTSINYNLINIGDVVEFLLNNGVDVDKPDSFGIYPLQQAIEINSHPFVSALIETRNVDLNRRFKSKMNETTLLNKTRNFNHSQNSENTDYKTEIRNGSTYLHLAAKKKDHQIFNQLLNLNVIDINSVDDNGETPLFIAFRFLNAVIIQNLFLNDNLDFKFKNKAGRDVLYYAYDYFSFIISKNRRNLIRKNVLVPAIDDKIETKGDYVSKLLEITNFIAMVHS